MLIGIWVTTGCNLMCRYCYEGIEKKCKNMTQDVADCIIKFIKTVYKPTKQEPLIVEFHGGEPLINFSIIQYIISELEKSSLKSLFGITTNGLLLTKEIVSYLCEKMTYGVSLSLDGDMLTNDENRIDYNGNGTYTRVMKIVPELLKQKPDIRVRMTYTPETVERLGENIIHLIKCDFKNIVSVPDYFSPNWSAKKMEILLEQMKIVRKYYRENIDKLKSVRISILEDRFQNKGFCQGGKTNFHVLPNGDLYPCSYGVNETELLLGNVVKGTLLEDNIQRLEKINTSPVHKCQGCTIYSACLCSRCKIINKMVQGDFYEPIPVVCAIEHVKQNYWENNSK